MGLPEAARQSLHPQVLSYIERLESELQETRATKQQAETQRQTVQARYQALETRYDHLQEEYRLLLYKRFGRSSEKESAEDQPSLFEEAEVTADPEVVDTGTIAVEKHTRQKRGRKPIDESVPRVDILHDIPEQEKLCACEHRLVKIGEEVTERLQIIPEQIYVERHIRPKYACHHCEGSEDEDKPAVRIAPTPPTVIPGSIATVGLLAFIIVTKFVDHMPFYRQQKRFERLGIHISRQDMSNWVVAVGRMLGPLVELFRDLIRAGPIVNMDETRLQVLNEHGRANTSESRMWLSRGGDPKAPVCHYAYHPRRNAEHPREFLADCALFLQTDAYEVYERVAAEQPGIILVGCWAHARRRFHDAQKASKKAGAATEGLSYIRKLYRIETELRTLELSDESFAEKRRQQVEPVLQAFKAWLDKKAEQVVPSSLVGKAVAYTLNEWEKLTRYLDHADLRPDNNVAENAIRPFVVGRKNFLFSGSPGGATASCNLFSLIETAKQNGMNPYGYLYYVLSQLPEIRQTGNWQSLLPSELDPQEINTAFLSDVR
jgi:transposase